MKHIEEAAKNTYIIKPGWENEEFIEVKTLHDNNTNLIFAYQALKSFTKAKELVDSDAIGKKENIRILGIGNENKLHAMFIEAYSIAKYFMGNIAESFKWNPEEGKTAIPPFPMVFDGIQMMGVIEIYPSKEYDFCLEIEIMGSRGNLWIKGYREYLFDQPPLSMYIEDRFIAPTL